MRAPRGAGGGGGPARPLQPSSWLGLFPHRPLPSGEASGQSGRGHGAAPEAANCRTNVSWCKTFAPWSLLNPS